MQKRTQAQWHVSAIINAPVEKVWETFLQSFSALTPQEKSELNWEQIIQKVEKGHDTGIVKAQVGRHNEGRKYLEINAMSHSVVVQGEWWYRGEYSMSSHQRGTLFVYQVTNIAPGIGWWAARFVQGPQHARHMREQLYAFLQIIAEKLACSIEV